MQRIAYQLRIRAGREADYDEAHRNVWPDLLTDLIAAGVREYSIFRRAQELVLVLLVADFDRFLEQISRSESNRRWQQHMAPLFEPVLSLAPGETLARMHEVFYLSSATASTDPLLPQPASSTTPETADDVQP